MQITFSHSILLSNGRMSIPSLETILDPELAEMIVSRSAEIIPQDGILFRQGDPADCLYSMTATAGRDAETFRLSSVAFNDLIKTESKMQQAVLRILAGEVRVARQALSDLSLWSED